MIEIQGPNSLEAKLPFICVRKECRTQESAVLERSARDVHVAVGKSGERWGDPEVVILVVCPDAGASLQPKSVTTCQTEGCSAGVIVGVREPDACGWLPP